MESAGNGEEIANEKSADDPEVLNAKKPTDSLIDNEESPDKETNDLNEAVENNLERVNDDEPTEDTDAAQAIAEFDADEDEDADEDDAVNIIIKPTKGGSIYKTGVTYQARSQATNAQHQKPTRQGVNLNDPGNIQGVPTVDFSLNSLGEEDKPWKRPGADITDYFNYGFTEDTWTQYCEKQKILRQEYTNSALKPVVVGAAAGLGYTGLTMAQRNRFVGLSGRSFDSFKSAANINVIGMGANQRSLGGGLISKTCGRSSPNDVDSGDDDSKSTIGVNNAESGSSVFNGNSIVPGFSMPPPDFGVDQSATIAQLNSAVAVNAFNFPPPAFANATAGVFPNTAVPPPVMNANLFAQQQQGNQSCWPPSSVGSGIISLLSGPAVRSTGASNRISSEHRGQTPDNLFSDDEFTDSRRRRFHGDEEQDDRYDRDQYRSSRHSRSRSRERRYSSRSRRYHDETSSRDYSRHNERSSHRRSRDRDRYHSRSDRHSIQEGSSEGVRGSSRARSRERERSGGHRESRRELKRSDRDSRSGAPSSSSRSSRRHGGGDRRSDGKRSNRSPSPLSTSIPKLPGSPERVSVDPLVAAAAAAADIAAKISRDDGERVF